MSPHRRTPAYAVVALSGSRGGAPKYCNRLKEDSQLRRRRRREAVVTVAHQIGRVAPTYNKLPKDEPWVAGKGSARTSAPVCGASTMTF
jgi:hypothetical protein